jgi:predicted nucleotidyltransferase
MEKIVEAILAHKEELQRNYGVNHLKIFGSYARGEQRESSDLDVLVSLRAEADLLDFVALKERLEEITRLPVDLVSERGISTFIKPFIEKELIEVF